MASTAAKLEGTRTSCPLCTDVATKMCGSCRSISYCSPECQQADWPTHKILCKPFKDFTQRPASSDMRRILLFLPDEDKPRFAWAPVKRGLFGDDAIDMSKFDEYDKVFGRVEIQTNSWTGEDLGYGIQIMFDDNFFRQVPAREPSCVHGHPGRGWAGMARTGSRILRRPWATWR